MRHSGVSEGIRLTWSWEREQRSSVSPRMDSSGRSSSSSPPPPTRERWRRVSASMAGGGGPGGRRSRGGGDVTERETWGPVLLGWNPSNLARPTNGRPNPIVLAQQFNPHDKSRRLPMQGNQRDLWMWRRSCSLRLQSTRCCGGGFYRIALARKWPVLVMGGQGCGGS
jgi:hypothetical protein